MKSIQELEQIKQTTLEHLGVQAPNPGYRVLVGTATCGIAAGAKPVLEAFQEEINKRGLSNVKISITGCIGACRLEPMVDIIDPKGERVTYIHMNPQKVLRVVAEHIVNHRICLDYIIGTDATKK